MSSLAYGVSQGGLSIAKLCNVRAFGHSYAGGAGATRQGTTDMFPRVERTIDPTRYTMSHEGFGGYATAIGTNQLAPLAAVHVDAYLDPTKYNVHLYIETINSVSWYMNSLGQTAAQAGPNVLADMLAYFAARRAAGWDKLIAFAFFHPAGQTGYAAIDYVNTGLFAAKASGLIDDVVDMSLDARIPANSADTIHPNDFGYQLIADLTLPVLQRVYEKLPGVPGHIFSPAEVGQLLWWFEADTSTVTRDSDNNVSVLSDKSGWGFDLLASSAARPHWNASNPNDWRRKPTIDASSHVMTSGVNLDLSFTKQIYIIHLYSAGSGLMVEFGSNAGLVADAFALYHASAATGPEINAKGNAGTSYARANNPDMPRMISFSIDNTGPTPQCGVTNEGVVMPGLAVSNAGNSNFFGSARRLSFFGREGGAGPFSVMSLGASIAFSQIPTAAQLSKVFAYFKAKWPHY